MSHFGALHDHKPSLEAAKRASEVFLKRHMYLRESDGSVIKAEFAHLHYPLYWHYDILHGLKVMAETGFIRDKRCEPALDLLARKQLTDGGWPAERRYYKASTQLKLGNGYWGGTSKVRMNPWMTTDALFVLKAAGYIH